MGCADELTHQIQIASLFLLKLVVIGRGSKAIAAAMTTHEARVTVICRVVLVLVCLDSTGSARHRRSRVNARAMQSNSTKTTSSTFKAQLPRLVFHKCEAAFDNICVAVGRGTKHWSFVLPITLRVDFRSHTRHLSQRNGTSAERGGVLFPLSSEGSSAPPANPCRHPPPVPPPPPAFKTHDHLCAAFSVKSPGKSCENEDVSSNFTLRA